MMNDRAFELTSKALMGEQLTDEELKYLQKRDAKYKLVRYMYLEKVNAGSPSPEVTNFHFTPGDGFDEMPTIDIVNELVKVWN